MGRRVEKSGQTVPRYSRDQLAVDLLHAILQRSTCKRVKQACFIADRELRTIYAMGYNGPARGEDNSACRNQAGTCGCAHAETNALVKLRTEQTGLVMACTMMPCEGCAKLIANSGAIAHVAYLKPYRLDAGARLLQSLEIPVLPLIHVTTFYKTLSRAE